MIHGYAEFYFIESQLKEELNAKTNLFLFESTGIAN